MPDNEGGEDAPRWLPLESNPEVITKYMRSMGVPAPWSFSDVYGLDDELLMMIPQPCKAIVLLFPVTERYEEFREQEQDRITANGQGEVPASAYFMIQTIGNACGTVGLLHALGNNLDAIPLEDGFLKDFFASTKDMDPLQRGQYLEGDGGREISTAHEESSLEGQTEAPPVETSVNLHFVCLAQCDGALLEFDGRKPFPIHHGKSSPDAFVKDAAGVAQQFISRETGAHEFSMLALVGDNS